MPNVTVVHHSADYDGIFCREIARKFLPNAELVGWDFSDRSLEVPACDILYVMDLPLDAPFGFKWEGEIRSRRFYKGELIWIDHHKSAIESHPKDIAGYRVDGVAACRLAWQWFSKGYHNCTGDPDPLHPTKDYFVDRKVNEPLAVRLAGEYDVWDHRGDGDLEFQFGLDCQEIIPWEQMLDLGWGAKNVAETIVGEGRAAMQCYRKRDADILCSRSFLVGFEGLKFLALTTARCNSNTFTARDVPETGHDALMGFYYNGREWNFSLYHASHRKDLDLSQIAVKYGGGGHRGACGFKTKTIPFLT